MRVVRNFCGALGTKMVSVWPCDAVRPSPATGCVAASKVSKNGGALLPPRLTQPPRLMAAMAAHKGVFHWRKAGVLRIMRFILITNLWLIIRQTAAADHGACALL